MSESPKIIDRIIETSERNGGEDLKKKNIQK